MTEVIKIHIPSNNLNNCAKYCHVVFYKEITRVTWDKVNTQAVFMYILVCIIYILF